MKQMLNSTCGIKPETIREIACTSARQNRTDRPDIAQGTKKQECYIGILQIFGSAFSYKNHSGSLNNLAIAFQICMRRKRMGPGFHGQSRAGIYSLPPFPTTKEMIFSIPF